MPRVSIGCVLLGLVVRGPQVRMILAYERVGWLVPRQRKPEKTASTAPTPSRSTLERRLRKAEVEAKRFGPRWIGSTRDRFALIEVHRRVSHPPVSTVCTQIASRGRQEEQTRSSQGNEPE